MSTYVTLINASDSIELEDSTGLLGIPSGSSLGMPDTTRVYSQRWGASHDALVAVRHGNRATDITLNLRAATSAELVTVARRVVEVLRDAERWRLSGGEEGDRAYVSLQLANMSTPVVYDVVAGSLDWSQVLNHAANKSTNPMLLNCPVTLVLQPWGRTQALTVTTSSTITNGGGTAGSGGTYTLSAPSGDRITPVNVLVSLASGDNFKRLILTSRSRGDVSKVLDCLEAETSGGTGYTSASAVTSVNISSVSDQSVAAARGGKVFRVAHSNSAADTLTPVITWTIDKSRVPAMRGRWRALLRVDNNGSSTATAWALYYGGTTGSSIPAHGNASAPTDSGTLDYLVDLGYVEIPAQAQPDDQAAADFVMLLKGSFAANTANIDIDCLYLIPGDEPIVDIDLSTASAAQDQLLRDVLSPTPGLALLDSSSVLKSVTFNQVYGDQDLMLEPGLDVKWFILWADGSTTTATIAGHDLTDQATLRFSYYPTYEVLP